MKLTSINASYSAALWAIYLDYENFPTLTPRPILFSFSFHFSGRKLRNALDLHNLPNKNVFFSL
jgi:hypothetical protein